MCSATVEYLCHKPAAKVAAAWDWFWCMVSSLQRRSGRSGCNVMEVIGVMGRCGGRRRWTLLGSYNIHYVQQRVREP